MWEFPGRGSPSTRGTKASMKNDMTASIFRLFLAVVLTEMSMASYRIRNPMLRMVYNRMLEDSQEQECDHSKWYAVDTERLAKELSDVFVQCHQDEETSEFLKMCYDKADWVFTQMTHMVLKSVLSWFINQTSINGLLRRGSMFVFSKRQFQSLLGIDDHWKSASLLDLGAGDGRVTEKMAGHFEQVFATEASKPMTWRLQELGYRLLSLDEWADGSRTYNVISCLNLLDRCERPVTLLHDMKKVLDPENGRIIVAVVIPFRPYVEFGGVDHKPYEYLHINGTSFEEQVQSFAFNVLAPAGLRVESFSRLPYLCEGDLSRSFYILDDVVFVLKPS